MRVSLDGAAWYGLNRLAGGMYPAAELGVFPALNSTGLLALLGRPYFLPVLVVNRLAVAVPAVRAHFGQVPAAPGGVAVPRAEQTLDLGADPTAAFEFSTAQTGPTRMVRPADPSIPNPPSGSPPWVPALVWQEVAPAGVTFLTSYPTDGAGGLLLGDLPAFGAVGLWLRRWVHPEAVPRDPVAYRLCLTYEPEE